MTNLEVKCTCATPRINWNICIILIKSNNEDILQIKMKQNLLMDVIMAGAKESSRLLFVKRPVPCENSAFSKVSSKHCLGSRAGGGRGKFLFLGV